jgi:hypothetical protein
MIEFAQAILVMVTVWITPSGDAVYAPQFRNAPQGAESRAFDLAADFTFAEQVYGVDRYLLAALAYRESGFDPNALGEQNEFTVMQLHPRSKAGRETASFCKGHPAQCERAAILAAARVLSEGYRECGTEALALGYYRSGKCVAGPGARRVLEARERMVAALVAPPLQVTLQ